MLLTHGNTDQDKMDERADSNQNENLIGDGNNTAINPQTSNADNKKLENKIEEKISCNSECDDSSVNKTSNNIEVCRICLSNDRKLYPLMGRRLSLFNDIITKNGKEEASDALPPSICWECGARLTNLLSFRAKAMHTNELLVSLVRPNINILPVIQSIDREAHSLTSNLTNKFFMPDYADYHFVYSKSTPKIHEIILPNINISDDDTQIFDYIESSDENIIKNTKKVKKKKGVGKIGKVKKVEKVKKVDKRCKPANEVLNVDIFDITDLDNEQQLNEIRKRQFSSNYKNAAFKCTECFKGFLDEDAFKGHMSRHTDQCGVYECAVCKIRFKKLQALRNHTTSHTQKFSCKRCDYVTFRRHAAKLHEEFHNGTKYACPHCLENFDKLSTYMSHIRIKHPSDIVCELCGYSFVSAKGLGLHKKLKHRFDDQEVPPDGPWCTKCNVQFICKEALERHLQLSGKHTEEMEKRPHARRYRGLQDRNNKNEEGRKKRNVCKPEGPISCEQCEMQLPDPLAYYRHFRRVHPDKNRTNYPSMKSKSMCEVCGKMFQSLALLQDHSWTHTDSKQFKCSACDKQFVRKYRLIAHQRVHGEARGNHTCNVCSKSFTTASNMHRHMVSHTGLKPFKCEMCGKCFKHASEKRVHITYVHLKKPWPKRARGKRKDGQNQLQPTHTTVPDMPPQIGNLTEDKAIYYNMKI